MLNKTLFRVNLLDSQNAEFNLANLMNATMFHNDTIKSNTTE